MAALAALIASLSDLCLLYAANAPRPELALPQIESAWLILGGAVGALAIPLYGLGYWAASRVVATTSPAAARVVTAGGAGAGLIGGLIHGLTASHIHGGGSEAVAGADPLTSILTAGPLLPALWGVATLLVVVASVSFAWWVGRGRTPAPTGLALANPALVTIVIAVVGLPSVLLAAFLTPAAPNIAHLVFFLACAHATGRRRG
jgi:hypothetical protein